MYRSKSRQAAVVGGVGGHERFAGEILHQVQAMDANGTTAMVGGALVGMGNLRPLVRPAFVSKMSSWSLERRTFSSAVTKVGILNRITTTRK